jgi:large subunit ribosomal protein L31
MKKDIHPAYHSLEIIMTDGSKFTTRSTSNMGKLILDADIKTHPAWTGGVAQLNKNVGKVAKFNDRFGSFLTGGSTKKEETEGTEGTEEDSKK